MGIFNWMKAWVSASVGQEISDAPPPPPRQRTEWESYGRYLWIALLVVVLGGIAFAAESYFSAPGFSDWAVIVVAGDYHAHDGKNTEAFDNARRDIAAKLEQIGFSAENVQQFSVRPDRYPDTKPQLSDIELIARRLQTLTGETSGGCLIYFSTHGAPQGIGVGNAVLAPFTLENILASTCGERPTVVIVSACYSGVFVSPLSGPNRLIVTAARSDRTSFGCSAGDRYPYFDTCVLQVISDVHGFAELADRVRECVAQRERDTGMSPPSEPQISMGADIAANLPGW